MKLVLGAGIAGMGAYYASEDMDIFEQSNIAGGLCSGFEIDGYHFDNAVHLSFTNSELVRSIFDKTEYYIHKPEASSLYHGKWLRHPAQNNLFPCSAEEKIDAIKGFIKRQSENDVDNFSSWTRSQYGDWFYEHLFKPYNEKYWCTDLEKLGTDWIGNRIYRPTLDEVLYGSYTSETPNTYYAKEMRYPQKGGYISFIQSIIDKAESRGKIHYKKRVTMISAEQKNIEFSDGTKQKYDELYSSIPLPEMIKIIDEMPQPLKDKAKELEHTGVVLVSVGFNKVIDWNKMWFYFYDTDIMAARAYMPTIKSTQNAPEGCSSVQFEIYFNAKSGAPVQTSCIRNCEYAIEKINLANNEDIVFTDYRILPYGNVIFKKGTEQIAAEITEWMKDNGIIPIGRFGEWKYLWSDQAFLSGYNAVKEREKR